MPTSDLYTRIYDIVASVPVGKVTTYGAIAETIGMRSSARLVGWALNAVAGDMAIPCHRVVNRNGELSGRTHFETPHLMRDLLESEGVRFDGERVDMRHCFWHPGTKSPDGHE